METTEIKKTIKAHKFLIEFILNILAIQALWTIYRASLNFSLVLSSIILIVNVIYTLGVLIYSIKNKNLLITSIKALTNTKS